MEDASPELKAAFKTVVDTFKRHLVRVRIGKDKVWGGKAAKQALDEGTVFIDR